MLIHFIFDIQKGLAPTQSIYKSICNNEIHTEAMTHLLAFKYFSIDVLPICGLSIIWSERQWKRFLKACLTSEPPVLVPDWTIHLPEPRTVGHRCRYRQTSKCAIPKVICIWILICKSKDEIGLSGLTILLI